MTAPVDSWVGNGADMVLTSRAWTLKAGSALLPPIAPRHRELHEAARPTWRRRGFQTLVNEVLKVPATTLLSPVPCGWFQTLVNEVLKVPGQIVRQSRRVIHRVRHRNPPLPTFFRRAIALNC